MGSQSSVKPILNSEAGMAARSAQWSALRQLPMYTICVLVGLLGGAMGVALVIGLAILINLTLPPSASFAPGVILLMAASALAGAGITWLVARAARFSWHELRQGLGETGLRVMLVFSVLAALLQSLLFFVPV
jgi:hypothetical protein